MEALVRERLIVTLAEPSDVPQLLPLMEDFNRLEGIAWSRAAGEPALRRLIGDRSLGVVGLARADAAIEGYFVLTWGFDLEWNGRDAFVTELYVVPERRGHRVGAQLLDEATALARQHDVRALHLVVRPENAAAFELYRRAGFAVVPRQLLTKDLR